MVKLQVLSDQNGGRGCGPGTQLDFECVRLTPIHTEPSSQHSSPMPVDTNGDLIHKAPRVRTWPLRFNDYEVNLPPVVTHPPSTSDHVASTVHPLSDFLSYKFFSKEHKALLTAMVTHYEPKSFKHAAKDER